MGNILIIVAVGLCIGNFLYQMPFDVPQWDVALERSYFQALAIVIVHFVSKKRMV